MTCALMATEAPAEASFSNAEGLFAAGGAAALRCAESLDSPVDEVTTSDNCAVNWLERMTPARASPEPLNASVPL